jgi:hypothetical protein
MLASTTVVSTRIRRPVVRGCGEVEIDRAIADGAGEPGRTRADIAGPIRRIRRFLSSAGRSDCIIRPSSTASSAPWLKAGCRARRSSAPRSGAFDHARSQGVAGVAGMPEGEGPRLSARTVDDAASGQPRARAWTGGRTCVSPTWHKARCARSSIMLISGAPIGESASGQRTGRMSVFSSRTSRMFRATNAIRLSSARRSAATGKERFGATSESSANGGERRLNVAVTRAREKIVIVTSMPVEKISGMFATTRAPVTARDYLQTYLDYATKMSGGELDLARAATRRFGGSPKAEPGIGAEDGFIASQPEVVNSFSKMFPHQARCPPSLSLFGHTVSESGR